jgi:hypothetical protein
MTAATLEGDKVVNLHNELLGTVHDITVDVQSGHIAYVVMAHGGMFGVSDKLFAIPWEALTLDPVRKCFVMDMPLHKLDEAPAFGQGPGDHGEADTQWVENLHRYFGTQPPGKA